ncbi:Uncharacterised protein [Raoultella terrigena]|uniref:Cation efflux system protein CzcA n=1 Tax=Raoultella terrigena TaxID=577 RepID=A0A4U9DE64_RAOTE|nr:Uncharacterised protein [Raoultella terrigena]
MSEGKIQSSALAVRERSITLFLIILITVAGILAFFELGRAEDPPFTVKQMTIISAWPGATAQEMQIRSRNRWKSACRSSSGMTAPKLTPVPVWLFTMLSLQGQHAAFTGAGGFYQARKKLGDEAQNLPAGVIGPMVNDEFSDVTFALFALKAKGEPQRLLVRECGIVAPANLARAGGQKGQYYRRTGRAHLCLLLP